MSIGDPDYEHETSQACWDRFGEIGPEPIKPVLQGRHLISAGHKPGPNFGKALRAAYDAQIEDVTLDEDALLSIATPML